MTLEDTGRGERGSRAVGGPLRVLLVGESEEGARLLLRELRRGGYEPVHERVRAAGEMERSVREAGARGEPWEVAILDLHTPRFGTPEAVAVLRGLGHDTPLVVVGGRVGEEEAVEAVKAGAHDYVSRDNLARLGVAVRRGLGEAEAPRERGRAGEERDASSASPSTCSASQTSTGTSGA